jgi:hypothetical protein
MSIVDTCESCDSLKTENQKLKEIIRALKLKVNRIDRMTELLAEATKHPVMETKGMSKNIFT